MERKLLITGLLVSGAILSATAATQVYTTDNLGEVGAISDNGEYAAVSDVENFRAYLWSRSTGDFEEISADAGAPEVPARQRITGTSATDVTDSGMVVGSLFYADGHQEPAYYVDGEWTTLEMHYAARNTNEAVAVTPDGKVIAGYQFISDPASEIGGRYYPVQWKLEDGEYVLHAYTDIELPDHQGFFPYTQSSDGRVIGGQLYCGVASTVPALIVEGKLMVFDTFETRAEKWEYKGKWYCGEDENGKQIWTDDPNDPAIVYFEEYYIDGYHDTGTDSLEGGFMGCDAKGNFYGMRTHVTELDEDGNGILVKGAARYNMDTDTWSYDVDYQGFTAGLDGNYILTSGSTVLVDNVAKNVNDEFDFTTERSLAYLKSYSSDGQVIGGMTYEINPASGEYQYFPVVIELENPLTGIDTVITEGSSKPVVILSAGRIEVVGASDVKVYDLSGRIVSASAVSTLGSGIYVVEADGVSHKVAVR